LNEKYDLKLEKVRCCHPTPFFLDSPLRRQLFREMVSGHKALIELGREWCKESAPTYGEIWAMEDSIKGLEDVLPPLPIPKLSEIFDKFR